MLADTSAASAPTYAQGSLVRIGRSRLALVALQLALVVLAAHAFHIEESFGFLSITPLILGGFLVNAALPRAFRPPLFVALGMVAPLLVFGLGHGAVLIVLALGLIGLCHLPIPFGARVALILAAAVGLALARAEVIATPGAIATLVLPILAAMFMFRLAIYLYDLRHETKPASWWERLGYFFLLPNVCFPLFPVVDYQAFRRTYYDADEVAIYQKGVLWMLRGITHILLYRVIYYHVLPAPTEVRTLGEVVVYMLATYGLYLRISGQFHLIVGILCLFGFNLPETHHLYYLASSFNDYWRRINIYWKDFMMKLFYYPALMRLRRWGMTPALVGATIFVFLGTWLLHSYQWFWLRGRFALTGPDTLFWGILGGLVVVNSLQEAKRGAKRRKLATQKTDWSGAVSRSARIVAMFSFICVLWSMWSSPSVGAWVQLVSQAGNSGPTDWLVLGAGLVALIFGGAALLHISERGWQLTLLGQSPTFARSAAYVGVLALILLGASRGGVQQRVPTAGALIASIQVEGLNTTDEERADRGYYEGLLEAPKYTSALWLVRDQEPKDWENTRETGLLIDREGLLHHELAASFDGFAKRARVHTNQHGMRDREYTLAKPHGTHRIALLGASYTLGLGVADEAIWPALLEDRLNDAGAGSSYERFEVLNFGVGGYSILDNIVVTAQKVPPFQPDVVLFTIHTNEANRLSIQLARLLQKEKSLGIEGLDEVLAAAGIQPGMNSEQISALLKPHMDALLTWGLREIASSARGNRIVPAVVYLPVTVETEEQSRRTSDRLLRIARDAGFVTLSLHDVYGDIDRDDLKLAPWDSHPNAVGHRMIADRLYEVLWDHGRELKMGLQPEGISANSISAAPVSP